MALICLFTTTAGNTAPNEYELEINFLHNTEAVTDNVVTGYRLYIDNDLIAETGEVAAEIQTIACTVTRERGTYTFTISALFEDNPEGPQSAPFMFTLALKGDINCDDTVDLKDVIIGLQVLTNLDPPPNQLDTAGDINGDGKIGLEEVLYCLGKV